MDVCTANGGGGDDDVDEEENEDCADDLRCVAIPPG
jgi:hypothetical protein